MARFTPQQLLSRSDRAEIYGAQDSESRRPCVIKKTLPKIDSKVVRDCFKDQFDQLVAIESEHLVKIRGRVGSWSIILEPMAADLTRCSERFENNFAEVSRFLQQALQGLDALHSNGIVHERLELGHLFLDNAENYRLLVTPSAYQPSRDQPFRRAKPGPDAKHVAPELLLPDKFGPSGPQVDIYVLGVLTEQLLAGPTFEQRVLGDAHNQDPNAWLIWHASEKQLPDVEEFLPEVPRYFAELIARMTAKHQADRFQNAAECLAFLANPQAFSQPPRQAKTADTPRPAAEEVGQPLIEDVYQGPIRVTWSGIFRDPTLFLKPEARNHRRQFGMVGVMIALLLFLLVLRQDNGTLPDTSDSIALKPGEKAELPAPPVPMAELTLPDISAPPTENDTEIATENDTDTTPEQDETGKPVVEETKVVTEPSIESVQPADSWPTQTGDPKPQFVDQPSTDLYYEVQGRHFYPEIELMDWRALVIKQADAQSAATRAALQNIVQQKVPRGAVPFAIPDMHVDPRAWLTLAIHAYQRGEMKNAKELCQRSLRDAKHFHMPFVMPLRLLNHIQIDKAEFAAAVSECCQVLEWVDDMRHHPKYQAEFKDAADETAWWTGTLVGYLVDVREANLPSNVDVAPALKLIGQWKPTASWQPYQIARKDVYARKQRIMELWNERKAAEEEKQSAEDREADKAELRFEQRRREAFERMMQINAMRLGSMQLGSMPYGAGQYGAGQYGAGQGPYSSSGLQRNRYSSDSSNIAYGDFENGEARASRRLPPAVLPPDKFAHYHACDPVSLAQQTLRTIATATEYEVNHYSSQLSSVVAP